MRDIVERPESVLVLPIGQKKNVMLIEEYDLAADTWQLTLPGGKVIDPTPEGIRQQAQIELREETGFRAGRFEKLLDFYSNPGYVAHKVHLLVAYDLEWDPLEMDDGEEILVHTFTLDEALAATRVDCWCDPEAALALWLYADCVLRLTKQLDTKGSVLSIFYGIFTFEYNYLRKVLFQDLQDDLIYY